MEHVEDKHLAEAGNVSSSNQSPDECNSSNDSSPTASSSSEQNLIESSTINQDDDGEIKVVLECIKAQKVNDNLRKQKTKPKSTAEVPIHPKKNSSDSRSTELVITPIQSTVLLKQASNMPELRSRDKEMADKQPQNQIREEPMMVTDLPTNTVLKKNANSAPELRSNSQIQSGLPKIPTVATTGPAVKCGDCGDSFVDYLELMEHVEEVHLPAPDDEPPVQASSHQLKRKIGPKSKANKRQKLRIEQSASSNSVRIVSTENETLSAYSSAAAQIFSNSILSSKDKGPSKGAKEKRRQSCNSTSPTQRIDCGVNDHDKSVEQIKLPSLKRPADGPQVLASSKRPTRQSSSSSLIPDSDLAMNTSLPEESAKQLSLELNKSSTTNQSPKKVIHEAVPLVPCYILIKTPDLETPLTCGRCGLKFQFEKDILRHAERFHSHNLEGEAMSEDFSIVESAKSGEKICETSQLENEIRQRIGCIEKMISKSNDKSPSALFPKCSQCGDIFLDITYLEEHQRNIHQVILFLVLYVFAHISISIFKF